MTAPTRREFLAAAGGALATSSLAGRELRAADAERQDARAAVPPHRPLTVEGVHAYTDRVSVAAGETIRFHVSSAHPYELQVCRLGLDVDSPARDELVHSFGPSPAATQPIHPGSYVAVDKPLDPHAALPGLTIEVWVRRWRTMGRQAIVSQFDEPEACGFALFVNEDGSLSFYVGDGGRYDERNVLTTPPAQLHMEVNPQGLKHFPDNTPSSVTSNQWHHVVARFDGASRQIWVDGREVAQNAFSGVCRPGGAPLRIGAAGRQGLASALLDADIAMPALYGKALSPAEIEARFAAKALSKPADPALLGCWPLDEERGERVADSSPHGRHGRIINGGTWMIGGPALHADVPRFGHYAPKDDPQRGHALRLASDDLYDCRWKPSHEFRVPADARSGIYVGRIRFPLDGADRLYHVVFIVKKATARPRAPIAFLCATNSWKAYAATPFSPTWKGIKQSIGNNGFANSPGDPPAYCFYRPHQAGQGTYQLGFRMPWPVVGPYTTVGPPEWDYSHLCRQDRFTQVWLESHGYDYDTLSDTDVHVDPHVLDGYKVLYVVGHSEYWSFEAMESVQRFLDGGGNVILLSGNTAFWRVSFNDDASVIECRKGDAPGTQVRADRRGELWHSHDGRRGGMARECGFPAWRLFGLEYASLMGVGVPGVGPYKVRNPDHFLFKRPHDLQLRAGDSLAGAPGRALPQPIGHEGDVRVSTLAKFLVEPLPEGATPPTEDPAGITLLADGFADSRKLTFAWDYLQRPVPPAKNPPIDVAAEMIYWERPAGGHVFHAGSINAGSTLSLDPKWTGLMHNVLNHFGVTRAEANAREK
ncbi:MAG: LamG domain-containing protein [Isosphaeraceae bacterium]|nr:LamG domain-containing protein [Isosphaeraceae bacterium]